MQVENDKKFKTNRGETMKKLFSIILALLMLVGILASCGNYESPDKNPANTGSNGETTGGGNSNLGNDPENNPNEENTPVLSEKSGNQVYFAIEEKKDYYTEIKDYVEITDCFEIPSDENGYKKTGAYFKVIPTYEELLTYIEAPDLDSNIFDLNYVVCVKQFFYDGTHKKRLIGYYDLNFSNDKYNICLDHYKSEEQCPHTQESKPYEYTDFIVIPKNSVEYTEHLQQVTVNGRNDLEDEIYADDEGSLISPSFKSSHSYVTHNINATLPKNPTSWVIKEGSSLENSYELEYYNKHSETVYRVVLYLPNEPECDFMITEKEIKNGNLYLTVEAYTQYTNEYLNKKDVKFYDLYISDSSELSENYDVYITVLETSAPVINAVCKPINTVSEKKAIMLAQKHFYETYGEEFTEHYYVEEVTSALVNLSESDVWCVIIAPSNSNSSGKEYNYYISKTIGEILDIRILP